MWYQKLHVEQTNLKGNQFTEFLKGGKNKIKEGK